MIAAFATSSLFLVCYVDLPRAGRIGAVHASGLRAAAVLHHPHHPRHARGHGPAAGDRHAVAGLSGRFARHRAIARWTLPIWLYVSVTGVLVYVLLYQPTWLF